MNRSQPERIPLLPPWLLPSLLGLTIAVVAARPALATPYVDISGDWAAYGFSLSADPGPPSPGPDNMPPGLVISCYGGASSGGLVGGGCTDSLTLDQTVSASGTYSASSTAGVELTNTSGQAIDDVIYFNTDFADVVGDGLVGIDSLATESSGFTTSVFGPGVDSAHACTTTPFTPPGCQLYEAPYNIGPTPYALGISSPDTSQDPYDLPVDLAPGASLLIPYSITINAQFVLPEPSSLALAATALLLLGLLASAHSSLRRRSR